jgi:hypothetical protein
MWLINNAYKDNTEDYEFDLFEKSDIAYNMLKFYIRCIV